MRRERTLHGVVPFWTASAARQFGVSLLLGLLVVACSAQGPAAPIVAAPSVSSSASVTKTGAAAKLQGTWELTKFESLSSVPDEATPILGRLHGVVRLRISGDQITTFVVGDANEETCSFEILEESGQNFTLVTGLGMFRRAQARFLSDDSWEATENGPTWPGTTRFTRVKPSP